MQKTAGSARQIEENPGGTLQNYEDGWPLASMISFAVLVAASSMVS
jgi:hypothetical protein